MNYELVELSVRQYLGEYLGKTSWTHLRYAVGVKVGEKVYDFKTAQEYKYIDRNKEGVLNVLPKDLVEQEIYAVNWSGMIFDANQEYSEEFIEEKINSCDLFTKEYQKIKRKTKQ